MSSTPILSLAAGFTSARVTATGQPLTPTRQKNKRSRGFKQLQHTPEKFPQKKQRKYQTRPTMRRVNGKITPSIEILFTPNGKKRRTNGIIYTWYVYFKDGSKKIYIGETRQSLKRRSDQHIRQGHTTKNPNDRFHLYLRDFAENPNTEIIKITVSLRDAPEKELDLRKEEELYILAENSLIGSQARQTLAQNGLNLQGIRQVQGLNRIHAHKNLHKRFLEKSFEIIEKPVASAINTPPAFTVTEYVVNRARKKLCFSAS